MNKEISKLTGIRFIPRLNMWEARISIDGRQTSKTFSSKDDAIEWRERLKNPIVINTTKCSNLFKDWLKNPFGNYSPQTIYIYEQNVRLYINPVFGELNPKEIDDNSILSFALKLAETPTQQGNKRSLKTVRNIIGTLSTFFEWCCFKDFIHKNPVKEPKVTQNICRLFKRERMDSKFTTNIKKKALNIEEAKKLIVQAYARGFQTGLIVEFLIYTGLRIGEIAALTWGDLQYMEINQLGEGSQFISVNKTMNHRTRQIQESAKCGSNGFVEVSPAIAAKLLQWNQKAHELGYEIVKTASIFPMVAKNPNEFSKVITSLAKKAGIKHTSAHSLRHTTITFLASAGHSMQVVQKIARHKTSDMTTAYFDATQLPIAGVTSSIDRFLA
ncbi:tyrosine-type recombinase/integrase [Fluviispira multicolorata]|uniref:Tyrosine-type recombinase/integrase n=1 Tax=Fluviispira multicolorata TaxID=2654512 RepID=A0A833N6C9_9BACT|nr:site-specific integrase [Fluviispira multicolorata]KAB8029883.1 tyrosine-type recombinase/integrase [Fluviispira multicolorata]